MFRAANCYCSNAKFMANHEKCVSSMFHVVGLDIPYHTVPAYYYLGYVCTKKQPKPPLPLFTWSSYVVGAC